MKNNMQLYIFGKHDYEGGGEPVWSMIDFQ